MKLNNVLALGIAAALGFAANANAGTITFDRNGAAAGGAILVDTFDWTPDNVLFKNLITSVVAQLGPVKTLSTTISSSFDLFGQGKLGTFISLSDANPNGVNGCDSPAAGNPQNCSTLLGEFTYEFGVHMDTTSTATSGTETKIGADVSASGTNYFKIFFNNPATSNQLAGTGYTNASPILTGTFVDGSLNYVIDQSTAKKLDNQGVDNYAGTGTYTGNGSFVDFNIDVGFQNNDFFKTQLDNLVFGMNLTSQAATPFGQANPAAKVAGNTPNFGSNTSGSFTKMDDFVCQNAPTSTTPVGTTTCDFLAQSDASSAFFNPIPEPTSLALMGAGLLFGGLKRKQRKASV